MGFGTGLNALLSLNEAIRFNQKIFYHTIEPYPLSNKEAQQLNYASLINENLQQSFLQLHRCEWNTEVSIHPLFSFQRSNLALQDFETANKFHLIYFDAFDPNAQPEVWTSFIFGKMFHLLYNKGILVTYCSKGAVRRAMQAAGFSVEKLPGPPGKREMIRAIKYAV